MATRPIYGLLGALPVLLAACGGNAAASSSVAVATPVSLTTVDGTQQLTLSVGNAMRFDPSAVVVRSGQSIEVTLSNAGQQPHDFSLTDGISPPVKVEADGGQTSRAVFTLSQPGTYTFFCSRPGHRAAGMTGTITDE